MRTNPCHHHVNPGPVRHKRMMGWMRAGYALPFLVLAASLAVTWQLWENEQQNSLRALRADFDFRAREAESLVGQRMKTYEQVMRGVQGLFAASRVVGREEFRDYIARLRLKENYPGIQGIRFAPLVAQAEKNRHIAAMRGQGLSGYITHPEGRRDFYTPVIYAEPYDARNRMIFGYDTYSDLEHPRPGDSASGLRRAAMERARDTGEPALSGKIRLVFETEKDKQAGFLMFLPVYRHGTPHATPAERRANITGWISAVFRAGDLMVGILGTHAPDLDFDIFDGEEISARTLLHDADRGGGNHYLNARFRDVRRLEIAGRAWTMRIYSLPGFEARLDRGKPQLIAHAGIGASLLLALLTGLLVHGGIRTAQAARKIRESEAELHAILDNAPLGIWLAGVDKRYRFVNRTFCDAVGIPEDRFLAAPHLADVLGAAPAAACLESDRACLAQETPHLSRETLTFADGRPHLLEITKVKLRDSMGEVIGIIGIGADITERSRAEEQIRQRLIQTDAIARLSEAVSHAEQLDQIYETALDALEQSVGCDRAAILLFDADGIIRFKALRGISEAYIRRFTGYSPWRADEKNPHPILVPDAEEWEEGKTLRAGFRREGIRALGFIPLLHQGRLLGKFMVYFNRAHPFSVEEVQLIQTIARHVGYAIGQKQAETALSESEQRWSFALEGAGDGVWDWDIQAGKLTMSENGKAMFGFAGDEIGDDMAVWQARVHPEDWERLTEDTRKYFCGECASYSSEYRLQCKDGSWKWVLARGMAVKRAANGHVLHMIGTCTDMTGRKLAEESIHRHANYDLLTQLPNRRLFRDRLEQEIRKAHRTNLPVALMLVDLDNFKEVNDTLGHDMGDLLLVEAARRIGGCVRESDTVARLGGDEFTVILPEPGGAGAVDRVAQDILDKLADPFRLGEDKAFVSASIGVTLHPDDAADVDGLLKNADQAMYVAKNTGRNRYSYFTPTLQQAAQTRMHLIADLRGALDNGQLRVAYQPIVELATGSIHKAEALVRWQHPQRGLISPAEFIPLAEETGLIVEIGDWVFKEAARQSLRWRALHHPAFQVSVNKSPVQFRSQHTTHKLWPCHLQEQGLPGDGMVIEITEGLLLDDSAHVAEKLRAYREAGMQISLDDFGTGYSSLSYVKKFSLDYLKIDQSFVRELESDARDLALCEAIIVVAHKLGMKVIAEGIETEAQRGLLAAAGCDYGQGYFFSRPVPADEFEAMLKGRR